MERPPALANLWTLFQIAGWAIAFASVALYFARQNYEFILRKVALLYLRFQRDPAVPGPPES